MRVKIYFMRAWLRRHRAKGHSPDAAMIWKRIRMNWPALSAHDQETIFHGSN